MIKIVEFSLKNVSIIHREIFNENENHHKLATNSTTNKLNFTKKINISNEKLQSSK